MTELPGNGESGLAIGLLLVQGEGTRARTTRGGRSPSGEFAGARLRVLVTETVSAMNICGGALVVEAT